MYRRFAIIINYYYKFYIDGAIDVMLMSEHADDRKGDGAIDVLRQCRLLKVKIHFNK